MGTRSLTYIYDGRSKVLCMYRQYDGYPTGHGAELADFLKPFRVVNGLGAPSNEKIANGMGCLAAQLVTHFKGFGAGNFYLMSTSRKLDAWQEYEYHVRDKSITVFDLYGDGDKPKRQIFKGTWQQYYCWIVEQLAKKAKHAA